MVENQTLKQHIEEEVSKRSHAQSELKAHLQEITVVRIAEKQSSKVFAYVRVGMFWQVLLSGRCSCLTGNFPKVLLTGTSSRCS